VVIVVRIRSAISSPVGATVSNDANPSVQCGP